jgi:hypothetical protein
MARQQVDEYRSSLRMRGAVNGIISNLMQTNPDGTRTIDRSKATQMMASINAPLEMQSAVMKELDEMDKSVQSWQKVQTDHRADIAHSAINMIDAGLDPQTAVAGAIAYAKGNNMASDPEIVPITDAAGRAKSPEEMKQLLYGIRSLSEKYMKMGEPVKLGGAARPGGTPEILASPITGKTIASGLAAGPEKTPTPTEASLAADAANPASPTQGQSRTALGLLKPAKSETADDKFDRIQTAINMKQPVDPNDFAWWNAYKTRKTLGVDESGRIGLARQIAMEDFQKQEEGRKFIRDKVEAPYADAAEKADILRNVVAAAKGGNMVAGSLQPLLATLGVTTMEGIKRINSVEIQQVAGAGSILDRIKGRVGKLVDGQPMDAALQNDLIQLANVLQKGAYEKYSGEFNRNKSRYHLDNEIPIAPPALGPIAAPPDALGDLARRRGVVP